MSKSGIKCDICNGAVRLRSPKRKYSESAFSAAIAFSAGTIKVLIMHRLRTMADVTFLFEEVVEVIQNFLQNYFVL